MAQPRKGDPYPYPYPFRGEDFPQFKTRHEAAALIVEFQRTGHIKKCAHVNVEEVGRLAAPSVFQPCCYKDSFQVKGPYYITTPDYEKYRLFTGCPPDCRYFEAAWKGKAREWWEWAWWPFRRGVVGIAQWFASLNGVVQVVLLLVILLVLAGASLLKAVTELLKVIYAR